MTPSIDAGKDTYFAPAERADRHSLLHDRQAFLASPLAAALLDAIPEIVLILNRHRQIIAANEHACRALGVPDADALVGLRPGEAVGCIHAAECLGGCGTSRFCVDCGAARSILDCLTTGSSTARECRILTTDAGGARALNLQVQSTLVSLPDAEVVVVAMRDISAEKRREVLERVFLHDLLNTINNVSGLAHVLMARADRIDADGLRYHLERLSRFARQVAEEVAHHRQLVAAESGDLKLSPEPIALSAFLAELRAAYSHPEVARGRELILQSAPDDCIVSDPVLLRRVLGNLLTNALEATPAGAAATIGCEVREGEVIFTVHNPGCIPPEAQTQIFQRSFSTKGGTGRGIGTYSVKLLGERYLGGRVTFTTSESEGTAFTFILPAGEDPPATDAPGACPASA